ncbi:hypothetical protein [Cysteiniphilum marinum]|uniref:hypothetical protein n=1 Tax=Cysteiniphilum marinum TaxID=2774191 RepID=UPI00193BBF0F|nr:hypothetical protein [Cysteiniphilum marinum]
MKNLNILTKTKNAYAALNNLIAYIPRKVHAYLIALIMTAPILSHADGVVTDKGLFEWAESITGGVGSLKGLMWITATLAGVVSAAMGFIYLALNVMNPDYKGKVTKGKAVGMIIVGALVTCASVVFGMVTRSVGGEINADALTGDGFAAFE